MPQEKNIMLYLQETILYLQDIILYLQDIILYLQDNILYLQDNMWYLQDSITQLGHNAHVGITQPKHNALLLSDDRLCILSIIQSMVLLPALSESNEGFAEPGHNACVLLNDW